MGLRSHPQFPPRGDAVGENLSSLTPTITSPVHHITTTGTLTTISPPVGIGRDFTGPVYFIADSVFDWTTSGNIAAGPGTTLLASNAYGFVYDKDAGKWYPLGITP